MYTPSIPCSWCEVSIALVESFLVFDECDEEWDIILSALLHQLVYDVCVVCR